MRMLSRIMSMIMLLISPCLFADDAPTKFTMTTNAFLDTGILPVLYTCQGKGISPDLAWTNPPAHTQSYALIMEDLDAMEKPFYHWFLIDLPPTTTQLTAGQPTLPLGTLAIDNYLGKPLYSGPCPPKGVAHTYKFTLYALDTKLTYLNHASARDIFVDITKHTIGKAELTTVFSPWGDEKK